MPTYRWNPTTSQWTEFVSTSMTSGTNVYVKLSGTNEAMTTSNSNRLRAIYIHDGATWRRAYKGYLPNPPVAPAAPTLSLSTTAGSVWNDYVDQTALKWTAVAVPADATSMIYELETYASKDTTPGVASPTRTYSSSSTATGLMPIPVGGSRYYRIRAVASNVGGTTYGGWSGWIGVQSGGTSAWSSTTGNKSLLSNGDYYVGTGSPSDYFYKKTDTYVTSCEVLILRVAPYDTTAQVSLSGPGFEDPYYQTFTMYAGESGTRFYVSPNALGQWRYVVNVYSGWRSGDTIKLTWTGTKNGTNSQIF